MRPYIYTSKTFRSVYPAATIYRCPTCDLVQANASAIDDAALTDYYRYAYRQEAKITSDESEQSKAYYRARGEALLALVRKHGPSDPQRIFEVGAGYGYNLAAARETYPAAELLTDELDQQLQGAMGVEQGQLEDGPFDVIIMSHVLEHFTDPRGMLTRAAAALSPSGVLVIEVPNDETGESSVTPMDEPHISFFSTATLTAMIDNAGSLHLADIFTAGRKFESFQGWKARLRRAAVALPFLRSVMLRLRAALKRGPAGSADLDFATPNKSGIFLRAALKRS